MLLNWRVILFKKSCVLAISQCLWAVSASDSALWLCRNELSQAVHVCVANLVSCLCSFHRNVHLQSEVCRFCAWGGATQPVGCSLNLGCSVNLGCNVNSHTPCACRGCSADPSHSHNTFCFPPPWILQDGATGGGNLPAQLASCSAARLTACIHRPETLPPWDLTQSQLELDCPWRPQVQRGKVHLCWVLQPLSLLCCCSSCSLIPPGLNPSATNAH